MSATTAGELRAAACLRLLALALAPPSHTGREAVLDLADALGETGADVDVGVISDAFGRTALDELVATHSRLFGGGVALAPYESSYERDPFRQARVIADVAGFYRAFGAAAHGPAAERPDHAGTELEFLGFLAERRVAALDAGDLDDAERIRQIEDAFLTDHAGRWLPGFFRALAEADPGCPFGAIGLVGEQVVASELVARGLGGIDEVSRARTLLTSVEHDEVECAAAPTPPDAGLPFR